MYLLEGRLLERGPLALIMPEYPYQEKTVLKILQKRGLDLGWLRQLLKSLRKAMVWLDAAIKWGMISNIKTPSGRNK